MDSEPETDNPTTWHFYGPAATRAFARTLRSFVLARSMTGWPVKNVIVRVADPRTIQRREHMKPWDIEVLRERVSEIVGSLVDDVAFSCVPGMNYEGGNS